MGFGPRAWPVLTGPEKEQEERKGLKKERTSTETGRRLRCSRQKWENNWESVVFQKQMGFGWRK